MEKGIKSNCPFCGNSNIVLTVCSDNMCDDKDCVGCRCRTYAVCCSMHAGGCGATSGYRQTPEEAIEAWERRALPDNGVIVPKCKVGDTIYRLYPRHNAVVACVIIEIIITEGEINYIDDSDNLIKGEDIGKTVFLTKEEAKRALAERSGNGKN